MTEIRLAGSHALASGKTPDNALQTLFISDLHLDPARADTIELSLQFFADAKGSQALFIIGDLFEYWLGDDAIDPGYNKIVDALKAVSASGTAVHLMHGNRDFLLGERFAQRIGATLHRADHIEVLIGDTRYSLLHGDTLCTDDVDYQRLRRMVRDEQWQQGFLQLSIDERIAQAQALRDKSREAVSSKTQGIMDVNDDAVHAHCIAHPNNALIHGHTHRPADHELPASSPTPRRLVLGDWKSDHALIARHNGTELLLEKYNGVPCG